MVIIGTILITGVATTRAQEQESKLIDRILTPNMSLVNSAQGKQFGVAGTLAAKRISVRDFSTRDRSPAKSFTAGSASSPGQLATRAFVSKAEAANVSARSQLPTDLVYVASAAQDARTAPENGRSLTVTPFPGSRPFSGQGKSQKALSARDTPLTIEQVRELLNKNK
jgi:hypothetical protein